jgi:hypothetical protein
VLKVLAETWKISDGSDLPLGFLGVAVTSTFLGNALLMSVEKESIIIRLVFGGGNAWVG